MLFSEDELSLEGFDDLTFEMDNTSGLRNPHEIFPQSSFKQFPKFDQKIEWQALLDEIDFYEIKTLEELLIFAFTQSVAETNPNIPVSHVHGETAKNVYDGFLNIKNANRGDTLPNGFMDDAGTNLALQLLREGYFPTGYNRYKQILLIEKPIAKRAQPAEDEDLNIELELFREARERKEQNPKEYEGVESDNYRDISLSNWQALYSSLTKG